MPSIEFLTEPCAHSSVVRPNSWSMCCVILISGLMTITGCGDSIPMSRSEGQSAPGEPLPVIGMFSDVSVEVGLNHRHEDGPSDSFEFPRSMGSGCGWFDADSDGRLDAIVVNGGKRIEPGSTGTVAFLSLQTSDGQFTDASASAGFEGDGYGMGLALGDIDNDGDTDVYITKYGPDQLFVNDGSGRFTDVSESAGILNPQWSTAAAFVDLNNDGWLDIVVGNYVDYFPGTFCSDGAGRQEFCGPQDFSGVPNRIFMNSGASEDGSVRFTDKSGETGLMKAPGKSLGLACRDFDSDGFVDIFVANDGEANQLWMQTPKGYTDEAYLRGVAVNRFGEPEANMGTVIADFSNDGEMDLLVTHLSGEMNTLWQGNASGQFVDQTSQSQMGPAGLAQTGFGVVAADFDSDGYTDLVVANGKVKRDRHRSESGSGFWDGYAERNQIFLGDGSDFQEVSDGPPGITFRKGVYRALAAGDYDEDGDPDLLLTEIGGVARVFRNDSKPRGHWLTIIPFDQKRRRVAFGARVVVSSAKRSWVAELLPHLSYLSSSEPVVHFGLGDVSRITGVSIYWPDDHGFVEEFSLPGVDSRITLTRGSGVRREVAGKSEAR